MRQKADKIPRCGKAPLVWFQKMAGMYGDHPRDLMRCEETLEKAGIAPGSISAATVEQAVRECLNPVKDWAAKHNADVEAGKAAGLVTIDDDAWLAGKPGTVRTEKQDIENKINEAYDKLPEKFRKKAEAKIPNLVSDPAPQTYNTPEPNTTPATEQETANVTAATVDITPKSLIVSQPAALALLKDLGFHNADKYDATKFAVKLKQLGKSGCDDTAEPSETSLKLLKKLALAVNDGQEIEVTPAKEKPDASKNGKPPKSGKKGKDKQSSAGNMADEPPPAAGSNGEAPKGKPKKGKPAKPAKDEKKGMSLLDAAAKVLTGLKNPLTSKEIVDKAVAKGYWIPTEGKTPWDTVKAAMLVEIKKKGKESRFAKPEPGKFSLAK